MLQDAKKLYRITKIVTGKLYIPQDIKKCSDGEKVVTGHKKVVQDYEKYLQDGKMLYRTAKYVTGHKKRGALNRKSCYGFNIFVFRRLNVYILLLRG